MVPIDRRPVSAQGRATQSGGRMDEHASLITISPPPRLRATTEEEQRVRPRSSLGTPCRLANRAGGLRQPAACLTPVVNSPDLPSVPLQDFDGSVETSRFR